MRLGTETINVMNNIMSRQTDGQPEPEVGMGATLLCWSDRKAATVIEVTNKFIKVQADTAVRVDKSGMSESQEYTYSPNPDGMVCTFRRERCGTWKEVRFKEETGCWRLTKGHGIMLGKRQKYYDFSF